MNKAARSQKKSLALLMAVCGVLAATLLHSHLSQAETLELQGYGALTSKKTEIIEAFEAGKNIKLFGRYVLSRGSLRSDIDLVMAQIEDLQREIQKFGRSKNNDMSKRVLELNEKSRSVRLASNGEINTFSNDLYDLVVEKANLRLTMENETEQFKKNNRVVLKYKDSEGIRLITDISVIRNGQPLRNSIPSLAAASQN